MSNLYNLRIATFGEKHSGKTVLLSTFYGRMRAANFVKKHGYSLVANSRAQGTELLDKFYDLEEEKFPPSSEDHIIYGFSLMVNEIDQVALTLDWDDYPGEWWQTDAVDSDHDYQRQMLPWNLLQSDAALFIIDGDKYKKGGKRYLKKLFGKFREEFERQRTHMELNASGQMPWPKTWIIALSKCDVFSENYTAKQFYEDINSSIPDEIDLMRDKLSFYNAESTFGKHFLLLSAVKMNEGKPDISVNRGLNLIPPLLFTASLEDLKNEYRNKSKTQPPRITQWLETNLHPLLVKFTKVGEYNQKVFANAERDGKSANALAKGIELIMRPLHLNDGKQNYYRIH